MREEDREILDEAIRNSAGGDDFDEMLLRATKKHLPRKYHRQFSVILEEILALADDLGTSNRSAALSLARKPAEAPAAPAKQVPAPPRLPAPEIAGKKADPTDDLIARHLNLPKAPANADAAGDRNAAAVPQPEMPVALTTEADKPALDEPGKAEDGGKPAEGSVEKLPEEHKIVDLGGTSPDSLPPELKDKLRKLVKAQKRKQAWEEGAPEEEPAPGIFFKGQQRAPPFVPLTKPAPKPEAKNGPAEKKPVGEDEEDLDEPAK